MKQLIQDLKDGNTVLEEVPVPSIKPGHILIKTTRTLVSLGTERMLVDFGKANYLQKARQQPEKVKMVLDKVKTDGLRPTFDAVWNKLNQPLPLGYCNVGEILEVGKGVTEFKVGDRVASNGNHAEYVCVPKNLAAIIPENVSDDEAAFTVIGAIGLQGIRLLKPTFGETIVIVGLGLIGLITADLLRANGCNVIGFDFDDDKIQIAKEKGIDAVNPAHGTDQVKYVLERTKGYGADGVIITASSKSDEIVSQAAQMCRKRGRIILVGVVGLKLNRSEFYEKEISFQVSCSYGPGRYDENYESRGIDYPFGFVRWTEKRNFEAILNALSKGDLNVNPLITEKVPFDQYNTIYKDMRKSGSIASLMFYDAHSDLQKSIAVGPPKEFQKRQGVIGIIGAGNFTSSTILPALRKLGASVKYIASSGGLSSTILAKRFDISLSTSDYTEILKDEEIDLVMVTTKHHMHARMVLDVLKAGKDVFVEKPLALNQEELQQIITQHEKGNNRISVGFNRRFAPLAEHLKSIIGQSGPLNIIATMNAGFIPADSWVHDMDTGGGRIIGEACHFIDLCTFISGSLVEEVCMSALGTNPEDNTDNASILIKYKNGSQAVINYFSNGSKAYPKERIEVYSQQRTVVIDNWRKLKGYGFKGPNKKSKQDKGHYNQFEKLLESQREGNVPIIPFEELINTTKASFAALESLRKNTWIKV